MRRAALILAVLACATATSVSAQTDVVHKRRPIPAAPRPQPFPARPAPGPPASSARLSLSTLRSPGDGGATCRSACARTRYACEVQEETCAPQWTSCLKTCSDAAAAPQSTLLPR